MSKRGASGGKRPAPRTAKNTARGARDSDAKGNTTKPGSAGTRAKKDRTANVVFDAPEPEPRVLRLGAVPGATPGRWIDTWQERMPHVRLELVPLAFATQRTALEEGAVDLALVRAPFDMDDMHAILLYDELPVVVASAESHLLAADELSPADLEGETLLTSAEDVLGGLDLPVTPARIPPLDTIEDAIATVASGVGIVVAPMSLARLHHRKDVDYRVLREAPVSPVLLAWPIDATTADVEAFVGIVRGRSARSSR